MIAYVDNLYSNISVFISTKDWSTPKIRTSRGIFQGGTLSPILFLRAFNPITHFVKFLPYKEFQRRSKGIPGSIGLPLVATFMYLEWDERHFSCLDSYTGDGKAKVLYSDDAGELVNVHSVKSH